MIQTPSTSQSNSPSEARLRKHADYQRAYQAARKQFSASMTWFLAVRPEVSPAMALRFPTSAPDAGPRVGLTVGKVLGKAHERNRIKRRMREAVRQHLRELPNGIDLILHPRRAVMTMDFVKLEAEVLRIFRQAAGQASQTQGVHARAVRAKASPAQVEAVKANTAKVDTTRPMGLIAGRPGAS